MQPATLVNLQDATTSLLTAAGFSGPVANTLMPIALSLVGILIGGLFVATLASAILNGVKIAFGHKNQNDKYTTHL